MARADMTADGLDATLRPERPKGQPAHLHLYAGTPVTQVCRQLADNAFAVAKRTGIGGVGAREMFRGSGELAPGNATVTKTAAISLATLCLLGMVASPHRLSVWHSYEDQLRRPTTNFPSATAWSATACRTVSSTSSYFLFDTAPSRLSRSPDPYRSRRINDQQTVPKPAPLLLTR
jgi:hypothetical protein